VQRSPQRSPIRVVVGLFLLLILVGTILLALPWANRDGGTGILTALFTATSAVCVTGLTVVDTATHWTPFGKTVILLLIQVGGLGIVTLATGIYLAASERLGLAQSRMLAAEKASTGLSSPRELVKRVLAVTLVGEGVLAVLLATRFVAAHEYDPFTAVIHGVFHAVSAWNNAGFALHTENLVRFADDPFVMFTVSGGVILGGLGFPVVYALLRLRRRELANLHARLTLAATAILLGGGFLAVLAGEWSNTSTLGNLPVAEKLPLAFFTAVQPRTAGFNALDIAAQTPATLLVTILLMFVGGASTSTAGGIKVGTLAVLVLALRSEILGRQDVTAFKRRIAGTVLRQAHTILLLSGVALTTGAALLMVTGMDFLGAIFEAASALGTVGLSHVGTQNITQAGRIVLIVLMFLGRLGPLTLAVSMTRRGQVPLHRYPEERPLIG
jgi:trk system potassium uptake protein TrkH